MFSNKLHAFGRDLKISSKTTKSWKESYKECNGLLFFWLDFLDFEQVVHQDVVTSVLVQQQNDVVFQGGVGEGSQEMNSSFGGNVDVVQDSSDEDQEEVAQGPAAVPAEQVLVELFQGELFIFGQTAVNKLD